MTTSITAGDSNRPAIHMIQREYEAISKIAEALEKNNPAVAALLNSELDRAELCDAYSIPADTVTMNCTVEFVDERSLARRSVKLVYPWDADISKNRISVLTPVGAGLIGMTAGNSIAWPDRSGAERILKIMSVQRPPFTADQAA